MRIVARSAETRSTKQEVGWRPTSADAAQN
jgi:hypothetical protein